MSGASYLEWYWAGALLAAITFAVPWRMGKPFGVSGQLARLINWRTEREALRQEAQMGTAAEQQRALLLATIEEFGEELPPELKNALPVSTPAARTRTGLLSTALFIGSISAGAACVTLWRGGAAELTLAMDPTFERYFGGGALGWMVLAVGGALVGFGTRMAGGCTSGHGLSGTSRLQPGSLLATACFFGTAVLCALAFKVLL